LRDHVFEGEGDQDDDAETTSDEPESADDRDDHDQADDHDADYPPPITLLDKTIEVLINRPREPDPSGRVQLALDKLAIAACERAARIFNADVA